MPRPLRAALCRASPSSPFRSSQSQIRRYSQQPPSATSNFYKTFTRPVAKCALLAVFTYQLVYFGWTKLEHEEIKAERRAEIIKLEAQVKRLQIAQEKAAAEAEAAAATAAANVEEAKVKEGTSETGSGGRPWWRW